MFQTIVIVFLICIIVYLIFDKKGIKSHEIKEFLKKSLTKIKEILFAFFKKIKVAYLSSKEKLKAHVEKINQKRDEERRESEYSFQQNANFSEESVNSMNKTDDEKTVEKVKAVKRGGFFSTLLCLILIVCVGLFAYKKIMLDFDGEYATDRLTYTDEYGFCMLITYYPSYQKGNAKGFAITHIPFGALFTEEVQANKYGNDAADSKEMLDAYQLLATWGDNDLVDSLTKSLSDSGMSTKSLDIGNHGKYFILHAKDVGYENTYY